MKGRIFTEYLALAVQVDDSSDISYKLNHTNKVIHSYIHLKQN